jgi:hypothetical protein
MTKLPSFQFYPGDWKKDPGIQALGLFEKGAWFEIMLLMHESTERGKLLLNGNPYPEDALAMALKITPEETRRVIEILTRYGVAGKDEKTGALINRRMIRDEQNRQIHAECGRLGGRPTKTKIPREKKPKQNQTNNQRAPQKITPSSSSSSSTSEIKEKNKTYYPLADFLKNQVEFNVPFQKIPTNYQEAWSNDFRLMEETDKIPMARIQAVLEWSTNDSFWKLNIRSASKFREQFGILEAKEKNDPQADVKRERRVGEASKTQEQKEIEKRKDAACREVAKKAHEKWDPIIEAAKTPEERDKLREQATKELKKSIDEVWGYRPKPENE